MKKQIFLRNMLALSVAAAMSVGFTSCDEKDEVVANPTSVSIDAAGGTQTIQVTSNTNWTVSGNPDWLTVAPTQGNKNGTITVMANSTNGSRNCVLYIQAGEAQATVSVNQGGGGGGEIETSTITPTITDANGQKVQVTSAGGFVFTYDNDGHLAGITDREKTYNVQKNKFVVSYIYKESNGNAEFTFDDNNITKIKVSESGSDDGANFTIEYTMNFSYDSSKRLKSCTGTGKIQDPEFSENSTATINYEWSNTQLRVRFNGTSSGYKQGEGSFNETYNNTFVYTLGSQSNRSKQLPYCMTRYMIMSSIDGGEDFELGQLFCVLGLFGYGPEYLPTGYSRNYTTNGENRYSDNNYVFSFTQNSNGLLMQENEGLKSSYDGSITWFDNLFNYTYTPTRADVLATQSLRELLYNSLHHTTHRQREITQNN